MVLNWLSSRRDPPPERREPRLISASSPEQPSCTLSAPADWFLDWATGGAEQSFGPLISERTAMTASAVYRCVTLRAGIRATLPLKVYRRTPTGREEAPDHRLARLLKVAPFPGRPLTAYAWRELWGMNTDLWGNHYSIIRYDNAGRVIGFEPVMPWACEVEQTSSGGNLYSGTRFDGTSFRVSHHDMIHIAGPGFDGVKGVSRIRSNARDAVALAKLLEQQTGVVHENAAQPSGVVTVPPNISPEGLRRMRAEFEARYTGRGNRGKVVFADVGSEFKPLQIPPEDLQTIESRRFQVADISRFFGVPLHLLNETDKSTSWGSGIAEQNLGFLIYGLDADLSRDEAELNYKLFDGTDYYCEYDRDALLAMDPLKAAEVAQSEIASGTLLINERRRQKNRPPVEGGDQPLINSANVPLSTILAPRPDPAEPAPQETSNA